ncbi:hypothetical protein MASR1M90_02250 [Desulfovibrionales bacterium]
MSSEYAMNTLRSILSYDEACAMLVDAPLGTYISSPAGKYIYVNERFAALFGYASSQDMLESVQDIATQIYISPADRQYFMREVEEKGQIVLGEFQLRKKDGTVFWVSQNARKVVDEQGRTKYYQGFCVDITDRKHIEAELKKQEESHRRLFETMSQGIVYHDALGRVIAINPAVERAFGVTREQMIGHPVIPDGWEVVDETGLDLNSHTHPAMQALHSGQPVRAVMGVRPPQAMEFLWVSVQAIPLFHAHTRTPFQVYAIFEDITATRKAEAKYQTLFQEMRSGFAVHEIICDSQGAPVDYRFLDVNPAFEQQTGLVRKDIVGKTVREVLPTLEHVWIDAFGRVALTGAPCTFEQYSAELDKYYSVHAFSPSAGQFACLFNDITIRKKIEMDLAEREQKYHFLADNVSDVIWVTDTDRQFIYISPSVQNLRGLTVDEAMREHPSQTMTPASWEHMSAETGRLWGEGQNLNSSLRMEVEQYHKDGHTLWVEIIVSLLRNSVGQVEGILGVSRDISKTRAIREQLRQAKEAAESASMAKSAFLANMSHEIRTPLNGILGMMQVLQLTELDAEQGEYVRLAITSVDRLTRLLSDILDLSRVEAGKMTLLEAAFTVSDLHDSVFDLFAMQAREKNVALTCVIDPSVPPVLVGDEARVRQILFNLVGNALKFTTTGSVTVTLEPLSGIKHGDLRVLISVEDTGIGIADEALHYLFQPFSQVNGTFTRSHQGAGLGLSIVRRLAELMHGHIYVESTPGHGTSMYVVLPFDLPQQQDEPEAEKE